MQDRLELLKLVYADEGSLGRSRITDRLSPRCFSTSFWYMWSTTFAFQLWHSAMEFRRYLHRFLLEFSRIDTLAGVKRTIYNQYDSLVLPLMTWLRRQGVSIVTECQVTDLEHRDANGKFLVTGIRYSHQGNSCLTTLNDRDVVLVTNGSMTDDSSFGTMTDAPVQRIPNGSNSWHLWEKLAEGRSGFGNPAAFNSIIAQSWWGSFTVTLQLKHAAFFASIRDFSSNEAGTGGLVTFKDSNWLLSIVLPHQPHFLNQSEGTQVFWGYSLFGDRIGNYVPKPMAECNGAEILKELCGHLRFDLDAVRSANCIPCRMPYITSMFMPRTLSDRPMPVPADSKNLGFIDQFVEIPEDVVFTVEYSVRTAQMAVYELLNIDLAVPPVTPHDKSLQTKMEAVIKAFA